MSKLAEYTPGAERPPRLSASDGLSIRAAVGSDLAAIAEIAAEREGGSIDHWLAVFERIHGDRQRAASPLLMVAALAERIIGYGKAEYFSPPQGAPSNVAPEGWYLAGVVVRPEFRRRGVGLELTRARLSWIASRTSQAYYFTNERNLVSIDLHRAIGFVELTREFFHPGGRFTGGTGILFVCDLTTLSPTAAPSVGPRGGTPR